MGRINEKNNYERDPSFLPRGKTRQLRPRREEGGGGGAARKRVRNAADEWCGMTLWMH